MPFIQLLETGGRNASHESPFSESRPPQWNQANCPCACIEGLGRNQQRAIGGSGWVENSLQPHCSDASGIARAPDVENVRPPLQTLAVAQPMMESHHERHRYQQYDRPRLIFTSGCAFIMIDSRGYFQHVDANLNEKDVERLWEHVREQDGDRNPYSSDGGAPSISSRVFTELDDQSIYNSSQVDYFVQELSHHGVDGRLPGIRISQGFREPISTPNDPEFSLGESYARAIAEEDLGLDEF